MRWFINSLLLLYLLITSLTDMKRKTVSIRMTVFAGLLGIVCHILWPQERTILWIAGVFPGMFLLLAAWLTRQAVGFGDGCVLIVIGLFTGITGSVGTLMTGLFLSCPVSLFLLVIKKADRRQTIPFVPFLAAGCLIWILR